MSELIDLVAQLELDDGFSGFGLDGVQLYKATSHIRLRPDLYGPSLRFVIQGRKIVNWGDEIDFYDSDSYMVLSVFMAHHYEIFASPENPFFELHIDIDMPQLYELISLILHRSDPLSKKENHWPRGTEIIPINDSILGVIKRLLRSLQNTAETKILGPDLKRELLFRVLQDKNTLTLQALADFYGKFASILCSVEMMRCNYSRGFDVDRMSKKMRVSRSSFYQAFKWVTGDSPQQYLKKIRLINAYNIICHKRIKARDATGIVGYKSVSQFSHDFKKYYGLSMNEMLKS